MPMKELIVWGDEAFLDQVGSLDLREVDILYQVSPEHPDRALFLLQLTEEGVPAEAARGLLQYPGVPALAFGDRSRFPELETALFLRTGEPIYSLKDLPDFTQETLERIWHQGVSGLLSGKIGEGFSFAELLFFSFPLHTTLRMAVLPPEGEQGELWMEEDRLIHARFWGMEGMDAVHELFQLREAWIHIASVPFPGEQRTLNHTVLDVLVDFVGDRLQEVSINEI